ncbi:MAG: hypothetical protein ACJ759_23130 [Thermoanaerobaculia bacterium]
MSSAAVSIRFPSARISIPESGAPTQSWSPRAESRTQKGPGTSTALQPA